MSAVVFSTIYCEDAGKSEGALNFDFSLSRFFMSGNM
jgi:hypothetical protein